MEHSIRTYFKEHDADDVKGFTVLEASDGKYHIAEKWLAGGTNGQDRWLDYWISATDLERRIEQGKCEPVGSLNDEQFAGVCSNVDHNAVNAEVPT